MNIRGVFRILGAILTFVGGSLLLPIICSLYYKDGDFSALLISFLIFVTVGVALWRFIPNGQELGTRDGFAVVTLGWVALAAFGSLPFLLTDYDISFTDAFFETMSGFTTTGATILEDVEALPHGVLFWRSLTHWLGGMGIIVLSLAILPMLGVGGMQLFKAEVPGPSVDKLQPRIQDTAKILWGVYALLTAIEVILLSLGGMNLFDALCHTFGTVATGGFSTRNAGIASYNSSYIEYVIAVFMILAGANFALHYRVLTGQFKSYSASQEFRFYLGVIVFVTVFIACELFFRRIYGFQTAIQKAVFQASSLMTTTGFHSANYETWPVFSQLILVILMFIGGCAGSTGGGIKVVRIYLMMKYGFAQLKRLLHPHAVIPIRLDRRSVSPEAISDVLGYVLLYLNIFVVSSLIMSLMGLDLTSSVSTVISTLGNIGPGIGTIGPTENFAHIPFAGKWLLSFLMLVGRLEIYTVLVLFTRSFWTK